MCAAFHQRRQGVPAEGVGTSRVSCRDLQPFKVKDTNAPSEMGSCEMGCHSGRNPVLFSFQSLGFLAIPIHPPLEVYEPVEAALAPRPLPAEVCVPVAVKKKCISSWRYLLEHYWSSAFTRCLPRQYSKEASRRERPQRNQWLTNIWLSTQADRASLGPSSPPPATDLGSWGFAEIAPDKVRGGKQVREKAAPQ